MTMRRLMNDVIHSILDPDMACYWRTRPRFLILDQPGQIAYAFARTLLYQLSPVVAGLLICTWWITSPLQPGAEAPTFRAGRMSNRLPRP